MTPLIERALDNLTTTCNETFLHSSDEDRIKVTLKALHKNGEPLDIDEIESWLVTNGWQSQPVKQLTKWAEAISTGGRVQIKHKAMAPTEKEILKLLKDTL